MGRRITFMKGDGIGQEIVPEVIRIVDAAMAVYGREPLIWDERFMGLDAKLTCGEALPKQTLESIRTNKVALKGPTHSDGSFSSVNVKLRKELDLYANVRPVRNLPGVKAHYENVDLVIFRENTEDIYAGEEHLIEGGAEAIKRITEKGSERIIRAAFEYALHKSRKLVTAFHKANIMPLTDGRYFLDIAKQVAEEYKEMGIEFNELIIDNACMQLVLDPTWLDVIVTENLYGDIVSDLCAGLVGGLGVIPGANIGSDYAVFEAAHGTAPKIAGKGIANPSALLLSAIMMLKHIGEEEVALKVENALIDTLREGLWVTGDINKGSQVSTIEMADAIIEKIRDC